MQGLLHAVRFCFVCSILLSSAYSFPLLRRPYSTSVSPIIRLLSVPKIILRLLSSSTFRIPHSHTLSTDRPCQCLFNLLLFLFSILWTEATTYDLYRKSNTSNLVIHPFCSVLYCTVLYCTLMHCNILFRSYCSVLQWSIDRSIAVCNVLRISTTRRAKRRRRRKRRLWTRLSL